MQIRKSTIEDAASVLEMYKEVTTIADGLTRQNEEVTVGFVMEFLTRSLETGLSLVTLDSKEKIIAEIHAYSPNLFCSKHLLTDLTIAVTPGYQGFGIGRKLFHSFIDTVTAEFKQITRIELMARESNAKAIQLYESIGFQVEGRMQARFLNADRTYEAEIPMAWLR